MDKKEEKNEELMIRLTLNSKEDQPLFDYFLKIKEYLGAKLNTEVARFCVKLAYEKLINDEIIKK